VPKFALFPPFDSIRVLAILAVLFAGLLVLGHYADPSHPESRYK